MLFKCHDCLKTLKVDPKVSGTHYQCECGTMMISEELSQCKKAEPFHCLSCGAALEKGAQQCGYCQRGVPEEKRLFTDFCPDCMARIPEEAAFCISCGSAQESGVYKNSVSEFSCPREHGQMQYIYFGKTGFHQCGECFGLWIHPENYNAALRVSNEKGQNITEPEAPPQLDFKYIKCPECDEIMNHRNIRGIVIDACSKHGYWFDEHEFENIRHLFLTGQVSLHDVLPYSRPPPQPSSPAQNMIAHTARNSDDLSSASSIIRSIFDIFS